MLSKTSWIIKNGMDTGQLTVDIETGTVYGTRGKPLKWKPDRRGKLCAVSFKLTKIYVHRVVAYAKYGDSALEMGMDIDHIDHNTFHNGGDNLRVLPHAQNASEGRQNASVQRKDMAYKVVSPITGKTMAIFNSMDLAKEYSIWKFEDDKFAAHRRRSNGTWHTNAQPYVEGQRG